VATDTQQFEFCETLTFLRPKLPKNYKNSACCFIYFDSYTGGGGVIISYKFYRMIPGTRFISRWFIFNVQASQLLKHADINFDLGTPDDGRIQSKHVATAFVI
jgi:hypothetical protein